METSTRIAKFVVSNTTYSLVSIETDGAIAYYELGVKVGEGSWETFGFNSLRDAFRALDGMVPYNATIVGKNERSWQIAKVETSGRVWRAAGTWNHLNGTPDYDSLFWYRKNRADYSIVFDMGESYKNQIKGMFGG